MNRLEYDMTVGMHDVPNGERRQSEDRRTDPRGSALDRRKGERRRGRPPRADARRHKVGFKANDDEQRRIEQIAKVNGQTVAAFIREAVLEAASDCSDDPVFRRPA
jgi:hypothetical protein